MTTKITFLIIFLLLVGSVSAINISQTQETKINHGDIAYYFPPNSGISDVDLSSTGIIIDGDKLITILQGGELEITLTSWSEEQGFSMVVRSFVPQTILYKYVIGGKKYYVQTDDGIFVDTYKIGDESLNITLIEESSEEIAVATAYTEKLPTWSKRNAFFVVFDGENAFFVKNSQILTIGLLFLVFILFLIFKRKVLK